MIKVRYAKSAIEHEEGMNHLWIQIAPLGQAENVRIELSLPAGIYRSRNLNGAYEDRSGLISVLDPQAANELFVEIFTREPIPPGERIIAVEISYRDESGTATSLKQLIPLQVVSEEESGSISTDEEVVRRIKELQLTPGSSETIEYIVHTPAKLIRMDSSCASEWEKKYRVDCHV